MSKVKGDGVFFCEVSTSYEAMFSDPEDERFLRWKDLILQQPKIFNTNFYLDKKIVSYLKRHGMSIQATRLCQPIISSVRGRMDLISAIRNKTVKTNCLDSGYCSESEYDAMADGILACAQQDCLQAFVQYISVDMQTAKLMKCLVRVLHL